MIHEPYIGQAVISAAGHDRGDALVITAVLDGGFVLVADGRLRKLDAPKKKKCMHLYPYPQKGVKGLEALKRGEQITDAEVRRYLKSLTAGALPQDT